MTIWLYTETENPLRAGPFTDIDEAMASAMWEWLGVCCWIERRTRGGWQFENVVWDGYYWFTTSSGLRPVEPERPEVIAEATDLGLR